EFLEYVFTSKNLKLRQQLALQLDTIPKEYQSKYESLLYDESFINIEIALKNLWNNFPLDRIKYLDLTKNLNGFNDKNIRILWLTLALKTEKYQDKQKINFYQELLNYSQLPFESSVRQNAISSLLHLNLYDTNALKSLVAATIHHKWQFTLFARNQIRTLLDSKKHLDFFKNLLKELPENQKNQLERLINQ
ncbi:MAG: M1 family peptidase, partial [Flavobacterium sp.]